MQDLIDDNKDKNELIFKTTQIVVDQQAREQENQDEARNNNHEIQQRLRELRDVDDGLMYAVTSNSRKMISAWGVADPLKTLVEVNGAAGAYPVVEGQPVNIIITTRNSQGEPIKASSPNEFRVIIAGKDSGHPLIAKERTVDGEDGPNAKKDTECASFVFTHFAPSPGWKAVQVLFRGETLHSGFYVYHTAEEADRAAVLSGGNDLTEQEAEEVNARLRLLVEPKTPSDVEMSVSMTPANAEPGDEVEVVVFFRDSASHRPLLNDEDRVEHIALSPFFGGITKAVWQNCLGTHHRIGRTSSYKATMQLPDSEDVEYAGVIATYKGQRSSALSWMKAPQDQGRVDLTKTVIACHPDPCAPGEIVTAFITTRGHHYEPAAIEDGQEVLFTIKGQNGVHEITPVEKLNDTTWRTTFIAERRGRSGIEVLYSGQPLGAATVETRASNKYDPSKSTVTLSPSDGAKAGQRVYVTIKTRDTEGHLAAGPAASTFIVNAVGNVVQSGGHKIHAVSRGSVDGVYHTHYTVENDSKIGDTAGVDIVLEGYGVERTVTVVAEEGEYVEEIELAVDPPVVAAFTRDPVLVEESAFVLINSETAPRVVSGTNIMVVGEPVAQRWADGVWLQRVYIGTRTGHASVNVFADNKSMPLTVSVDAAPLKLLNSEIARLRTIEMKFKEDWDGKWRGGNAALQGKGEKLSAKRSASKSSKKGKVIQYPKIGVELADDDGAKVWEDVRFYFNEMK